jgi:signal transduction histidine kinase
MEILKKIVMAMSRNFEKAGVPTGVVNGKTLMQQIGTVLDNIGATKAVTDEQENALSNMPVRGVQYIFNGAFVIPAVIGFILFCAICQGLAKRETATTKLQHVSVNRLNYVLGSFNHPGSGDRRMHLRSVKHLRSATADVSFMRHPWSDVMSNTLKYSGKMKNTAVGIGSFLREHDVYYYVKDNDVVFNVSYSNKIVGIFNRFHGQHECGVTDVVLTLTKRNIDRRGGQERVESILDKGTAFTFYYPEI